MSGTQTQSSQATLLWDHQDSIPLQKNFGGDDDIVLILTPAVVPLDPSRANASDPFEPLGQELARTHPLIRHVPYIKECGITKTHVEFIKIARVVIFVLTGFSSEEGALQLGFAEVARDACEERPIVLVACCEVSEGVAREYGFRTILQCPGYFPTYLRAVAFLLTSERPMTAAKSPLSDSPPPLTSPPMEWDYDRDLQDVNGLWEAALPSKFHLSRPTLGSLLKRDGYAMHYIVREPQSGKAVGFCATFTTFQDSSGDRLIGSVAIIIVQKEFRGQGIGRSLHDFAVSTLNKIRGVGIIQLGSTFPRLLYGLPSTATNGEWFNKRGWNLKESTPGNGRQVVDWLLRFADHPVPDLASAGLTFRPCQLSDAQQVLEMAKKESQKRYGFGWYDQYYETIDSGHANDIVLGLEGEDLIAAAITYFPNDGSPCSTDIPWPALIGQSIGGVSCICIQDEDPNMVSARYTVATRLLLACRQTFNERGMVGMFVDGSKSDGNLLQSLGFCKWAEYKELWYGV